MEYSVADYFSQMWNYMMGYGAAWFSYPGLSVATIFVCIGLAVAFGALWLCAFWPPLFKKYWLWAVLVVTPFLTLGAIIFVQTPLQYWINVGWTNAFESTTIMNWLLLIGIPSLLISGLVQEAAKMVPILIWRQRSGKNITPLLGMAIGAVAGAAFGVLEAFRVFGSLFTSGWTIDAISANGFLGIAGFWERFFIIAFHTGISAFVGYGIAKGKWWQYFLIASGVHALINYASLVAQFWAFKGGDYYTIIKVVEAYVAVLSVVVVTAVLLSRWGKRGLLPMPDDTMHIEEYTPVESVAAPEDTGISGTGEPEAEDRAAMPADTDAVVDTPADNPEDVDRGNDQGNP